MACCTGHSVIPIDWCHQRGWRWSSVIPDVMLTHTAANWQSHTCVPMTQGLTAVNTPKMVQTTSPLPMSMSKVSVPTSSDVKSFLSNTVNEAVRIKEQKAVQNVSNFPAWEKLNVMLFRNTKNYSMSQNTDKSSFFLNCWVVFLQSRI